MDVGKRVGRQRSLVGQRASGEVVLAGDFAYDVGLQPVRQRHPAVLRARRYLEQHQVPIEVFVDLP